MFASRKDADVEGVDDGELGSVRKESAGATVGMAGRPVMGVTSFRSPPTEQNGWSLSAVSIAYESRAHCWKHVNKGRCAKF